MSDWITEQMKQGDGMPCAECGCIIEGSAFSVLQSAGAFAVNTDSAGEEIETIYLCSSQCRSKKLGAFWRSYFPGGQ